MLSFATKKGFRPGLLWLLFLNPYSQTHHQMLKLAPAIFMEICTVDSNFRDSFASYFSDLSVLLNLVFRTWFALFFLSWICSMSLFKFLHWLFFQQSILHPFSLNLCYSAVAWLFLDIPLAAELSSFYRFWTQSNFLQLKEKSVLKQYFTFSISIWSNYISSYLHV